MGKSGIWPNFSVLGRWRCRLPSYFKATENKKMAAFGGWILWHYTSWKSLPSLLSHILRLYPQYLHVFLNPELVIPVGIKLYHSFVMMSTGDKTQGDLKLCNFVFRNTNGQPLFVGEPQIQVIYKYL